MAVGLNFEGPVYAKNRRLFCSICISPGGVTHSHLSAFLSKSCCEMAMANSLDAFSKRKHFHSRGRITNITILWNAETVQSIIFLTSCCAGYIIATSGSLFAAANNQEEPALSYTYLSSFPLSIKRRVPPMPSCHLLESII